MNIMEDDQSLDEVNATLSDPDQHKHFHIPVLPPAQHHGDPHHEDDYNNVVVTTHELPAPYGCR